MVHDLAVIGTGIVGLSTAYNFLKKHPGKRVLLIEKEDQFSKHQTGNNSGVIHSGIYYKPGSLKALNCQKGYSRLISYCQEKEIQHEICGKVIVATSEEQRLGLNLLWERGNQNKLSGLQRLKKEEVKELEPHVQCLEGIKVPQAGIVDFKEVSRQLYEDIINLGGHVEFKQKVRHLRARGNHIEIEASQHFQAKKVVNCAGLYSDRLAKENGIDLDIRIIPFRGEYYSLKKERSFLVKNLIYPVPDMNFPFLGVHFTRKLDGTVEAGPNAVLAFHREGYHFSKLSPRDLFDSLTWPGFLKLSSKHWRYGLHEIHRSLSKKAFVRSLQMLIPEVQTEDIEAGHAGVRAQACYRNGQLCDDFMIIQPQNGTVHVCNAPSPAATSSLAIGETIVNHLS